MPPLLRGCLVLLGTKRATLFRACGYAKASRQAGYWPAVRYWKVIMSVRLSVGALGFKGWFDRLPLP